MHYQPLNVPLSYPISAIYQNTAPNETSPWVMPGVYTVCLHVDGKRYCQRLEIKMDPRVKTSMADLQKQHDLSLQSYEMRKQCMELVKDVHAFRVGLQSQLTSAERSVAERLGPLERQAGALEGAQATGFGGGGGQQEPSFNRLNSSFASLFNVLQESDRPPTTQALQTFNELKKQFDELVKKWEELKSKQ